jgi:hypothetical protein
VHSILIAINPEGAELPVGHAYEMQLVALMETADYEDLKKRAAVDEALARIQQLIDRCPDIDLEVCVSQSMGQMTVDEFRDFAIWDYDEMSLELDIQPPRHIS